MLTESEKEIVLNSLWVVNSVLKELGESSNQDLRQFGIMYMCQCLKRYDSSKGCKWTSFAYNSLMFKVKQKRDKEYNRHKNLVSDTELYSLSSPFDEDRANAVAVLNQIKELLTDKELTVVEQKLKGYSLTDIAKQMGISRTYIGKLWRSIKDKATPLKTNYK